jgi:tetratricopeptide (TPR) repeat protein
MVELLVIILVSALAFRATFKIIDGPSDVSDKLGDKLGKLWEIAHQGMRDNKMLRAEKALLTILKIDEKNAAAYNRLGILYAKQKEYKDAIDCFEIASSIEKSASSLHNLGLIYYETENYSKAAVAFEEALGLEDGFAARHIAYAKVQEKLGNEKKMISELERAVELEPSTETHSLLLRAYDLTENQEKADELRKVLEKTTKAKNAPPKKVARPRRVVV